MSAARSAATVAGAASVLFTGLFAGFLVTVLVLELTLRDHGAEVYTQVRHVELARLDDLASATLLPALLAVAVLAVVGRNRGTGRRLVVTALVLLLGALVTTLIVNLPINDDQLGWVVQAPPADWADVRDRWQLAHAVRTTAAVAAFGCLTAALLTSTPHRGVTP